MIQTNIGMGIKMFIYSVENNYYYPSNLSLDHGLSEDPNTIMSAVNIIGNNPGIIYLSHISNNISTVYAVETFVSIPKNIKLVLEHGAVINGPGNISIDNPDCIGVFPRQMIFGDSITVTYINAGKIEVAWFGATGDGLTNDTASVQSAVTSAAAHSLIYFFDGIFILSNITGASNQLWCGRKREAVTLKHRAEATDYMVEAFGEFIIKNIGIDGNGHNQADFISTFYYNGTGGTLFRAENILSQNAKKIAIHGIYIEGRFEILDSMFKGLMEGDGANSTLCIYIQSGTGGYVVIKNNSFLGEMPVVNENACGGIQIAGSNESNMLSGVEISGNIFTHCGQALPNPIGAIDIYQWVRHVNIHNNQFYNSAYICIKVSNSYQSKIHDNQIEGVNHGFASSAIWFSGWNRTPIDDYHDIEISNNQIKDFSTGRSIYITGAVSHEVERPTVIGNKIVDCHGGIDFNYCKNAEAIGNVIDGNTGTTVNDVGILINNSSGQINISGGSIRNCAAYAICGRINISSLNINIEGMVIDNNLSNQIYLDGILEARLIHNRFIGSINPMIIMNAETVFLIGNIADTGTWDITAVSVPINDNNFIISP